MADVSGCDAFARGCDHSAFHSIVPPLYFIVFIVLGAFVMAQMVCAVILDNFIDVATSLDMLKRRNNFFDLFRKRIMMQNFARKLAYKVRRARSGDWAEGAATLRGEKYEGAEP